MKKILNLLIALVFLFGISGSSFAQEKIVVAGTGDCQQLLRILASAFEETHPGAEVEIPYSIGSGAGIKATAKGISDLGRVARPIKKSEKHYGLKYQVFAKSPIVFVVHPKVIGVENLSTEQIIGIYNGKYKSWKQLGSEDRKIYPVSREEGDSANSVLSKKMAGFKDIETFVSITAYNSPENVELLTGHAFTIGYGPLSIFKATKMKVVSVDGIEPSNENIKNGTYKYALPFGIVYKVELKGLAKRFLDYLYTSEAQKLIIENGAIPSR